jgi:hypothetical protein
VQSCECLDLSRAHECEVARIEEQHDPLAVEVRKFHAAWLRFTTNVRLYRHVGRRFANLNCHAFTPSTGATRSVDEATLPIDRAGIVTALASQARAGPLTGTWQRRPPLGWRLDSTSGDILRANASHRPARQRGTALERRSWGDERQQMKLFASAAVVAAIVRIGLGLI